MVGALSFTRQTPNGPTRFVPYRLVMPAVSDVASERNFTASISAARSLSFACFRSSAESRPRADLVDSITDLRDWHLLVGGGVRAAPSRALGAERDRVSPWIR